MKSIFAAALAVTGTASVALADEPVTLTDTQMDAVAAGALFDFSQVAVAVSEVDVRDSSTGDVVTETTAVNAASFTIDIGVDLGGEGPPFGEGP